MKRIVSLLLSAICISIATHGQEALNLNFERLDSQTGKPADWHKSGSDGFSTTLDSTVKHGGKYAYRVQSPAKMQKGHFSAPTFLVPAKYAGKEIELKGYVKTENVTDGWAGLWLRIDGDDRALEFDNMEKRGITGSTDWKQYSIKLKLPDEAKKIVFGGILAANGTMWIDDLTLMIDGEDLSKTKPKIEKLTKAQLDTTFRNGSGLSFSTLTAQQIDNLTALGHIWGFLKYHHPAVADGNYNWDFELFRVLPKVLNARSVNERSTTLSQWIDQLGPLPSGKRLDTASVKKAFLKPDLRWIADRKVVSDALAQRLSSVYKARNQGANYYISMDKNIGNPVIKNEESYAKMTYPDAGFRLLSLYRYWNLITYFFPYRHLIKEDWNAVLTEFIPKFSTAGNVQEYTLANLQLIGRIHDTHANIWGKNDALERWRGAYVSPVQVKFAEGKAVVTGYYNDSLGRISGLQRGDVIAKIDGKPVPALLDELFPFYPASNRPTQLRDIARSLLRGNNPTVQIEGTRNGQPLTVELKRAKMGSIALNNASDYSSYPQDSSYRILSDSIGYVFPGKIKNTQVPKIRNAFKNVKGIVVDLRCYPSEFIVFTLGSFFHTSPTPFVKFTAGDVANPGLFTWGPELKVGSRGVPNFDRKVVILINELTQSQAEYTTMAFRAAPNVTVIGSQTAGADGNVSGFQLPGGLYTMFSGIGVYYPDGRETQRIGIVPDVEVKPTIKGIQEGRDELLEKALDLLNQPKETAQHKAK
ncbi:S41 family peptidase [Tellurirhabdus bombi]|uniref:S41 family peptidase n=1 Tax=Tellurirhabdus bombi TaxID=2907205 RepID=UPI001F3C1313|nr:S41 family peptidase [Tellurirhabdus bombi]